MPTRRLYGPGILAVALLLASAPSLAHDLDFPIAGQKLLIDTEGPPQFRFRTASGQLPALALRHDPATEPAWLLVQGYGESPGSTGRIDLDPSRWQALERKGSVYGYRYRDPEGSRGGVQSILWKSGRLSIKGGGPNWRWSATGEQQQVGVYFGIEDETVCAHFGGRVRANQARQYLAYDAGAPSECPEAVCGNGIQELGEACDDGNRVETDGCSRECVATACEGESFASTFEALQRRVFDDGGCTNTICHGAEPGQAGLNLSPAVAYSNLVDVASTGTSHDRVVPGKSRESALWIRLAKAANPDATDEAGTPMPIAAPPVSQELIDAVQLWIAAGAPETGTVAGTEAALAACLPEVEPISISPLVPPGREVGVQLVMPPYPLPARSEGENCFATYYDFRDRVPERFRNDDESFNVKLSLTRADPHTHHMIVMHAGLHGITDDQAYDESFGTWSCIGGSRAGEECDPLDLSSCGEGICRSAVQDPAVACIGFGPPDGATGASTFGRIGGTGVGVAAIVPGDGYYRRVPLRGLVYWNSHAFNLTGFDHSMAARLNLLFADDARLETELFQNPDQIFLAAGQPPYTRETICARHELDLGTRVVGLSSHNHQRGEVFWIEDPSGERIYESFTYSDPVYQIYDPPLVFDSEDLVERTLTYCAIFNNGVAPDGSPDPATVRKRSVTPPNSDPCDPTACTQGRIGEACAGAVDHAACDTAPGTGDGLCDACPITEGLSTEDEMFVILGVIIRPEAEE